MVAEVIGAVSTALEIGKKARDLSKRLDNLELRELLADQQDALLAVREENQRLREENSALQKKMQEKDERWFDGELWWSGDEHEPDGPFCNVCHHKTGKLVPLHHNKEVSASASFGGYGPFWLCKVCNTSYKSER